MRNRLAATCAEPSWRRYLFLDRTLAEVEEAARPKILNSMAEELSAVLKWQPHHARAHQRLAAVHLRLFDNAQRLAEVPFALRQIREAAGRSLADPATSPAAVEDWLRRILGPRRQYLDAALHHAHRAVALCPLQGESYVYLAELAFLEGPDSPGKTAYVAQALKVRPFDGTILFEAGVEAMLWGNLEEAFTHWRKTVRISPATRERVFMLLLAGGVPAVDIIEALQLRSNLPALGVLTQLYRNPKRPDELPLVLGCVAQASEDRARTLKGEDAAKCWLDAAMAHRELGDFPRRFGCLQNALHCQSINFTARYELGMCLNELGELGQAEIHLTWCLRRRPDNESLRKLLESIAKNRRQVSARPTAGGLR